MEPDPVKQAEHYARIAEWGNRYGLNFKEGRAKVLGLTGPCVLDLTATHQDFWLQSTILQAFQQGATAGKNDLAQQFRALLGVPEASAKAGEEG